MCRHRTGAHDRLPLWYSEPLQFSDSPGLFSDLRIIMQPLYHGTRAGFAKGGLVQPQSIHGKVQRPGSGSEDAAWVFVTPHWDVASWYAIDTPGRGRAKVLTVMPVSPVEIDPSTWDGEEDQYRTEAARVLSVDFCD